LCDPRYELVPWHDLSERSRDITRWTRRRKAAVVLAIENVVISATKAEKQYRLSLEELAEWKRRFTSHGMYGLAATKSR
jgi:hypothetical protein